MQLGLATPRSENPYGEMGGGGSTGGISMGSPAADLVAEVPAVELPGHSPLLAVLLDRVEACWPRSRVGRGFCYLLIGAVCAGAALGICMAVNHHSPDACALGAQRGCDPADVPGSEGVPETCTHGALPICDSAQQSAIEAELDNGTYTSPISLAEGLGIAAAAVAPPLAVAYGRTAICFLKAGVTDACRVIAQALRR